MWGWSCGSARQKAEKQLSSLMAAKGSMEEELKRSSDSYKRLEESFKRAVEANRRVRTAPIQMDLLHRSSCECLKGESWAWQMDEELKRQKAEQEEARRASHLRKLQDGAYLPLIPTNAAASVPAGQAAAAGHVQGQGGREEEGGEGAVVMAVDPQAGALSRSLNPWRLNREWGVAEELKWGAGVTRVCDVH